MMTNKNSKLFAKFEALEIKPGEFGHRQHVQVAYEMLNKYDFLEASSRYIQVIKTLANNAGAPKKFNMTITIAFLALIAQRSNSTKQNSFEEFLIKNKDLLSKNVLNKWYSTEQLNSDFARTHFLLPDLT